MVSRLAEDPDQLTLGGEAREMTIMFSDVRGFTAIAERTSAEDLTRLVNLIMTRLTDAVLEHQGTIDKYIGDCLMAFWNAPLHDPDHARNACLAALSMIERMAGLNEELQREAASGSTLPANIAIGVGLNTGECLVGNMGSTHRFNYSVLGDTVNLSARLEGQTAYYGCTIVLGEEAAQQAPDLAMLELDLIRVKGKEQPSRIFGLLGDAGVRGGKAFSDLAGPHDEMLRAYRGHQWALASEKLEWCRANCGDFPLQRFYSLYAERIREFETEDPGPAWDGVFVAEKK
jgi:adenylate cyclase